MSIVEKAVDKHLRRQAETTAKKKPKEVEKGEPKVLPVEDEAAPDSGLIPPSESSGLHPRPPILELDFERLREASIVPPADLAPHLADEFRRIKRPLLANAFGKGVVPVEHGNLIMICSALSGEGKTFAAVNLAMSIALERERTVLLVDSDVAKPHISRATGLDQQPGLMDVLLDESLELSDVLVQTDMPGPRILPAGSRHRYATELLASEKMHDLVAEIAGRYSNRIVVFDSPPLLQTSEAQVLADLVGQIVMVVHAGATPQAAVETALELIDPSKAVNLVLNKCRVRSGSDYYGGYYGQDY